VSQYTVVKAGIQRLSSPWPDVTILFARIRVALSAATCHMTDIVYIYIYIYRSVVESRSPWPGQNRIYFSDLLLKPNWNFTFFGFLSDGRVPYSVLTVLLLFTMFLHTLVSCCCYLQCVLTWMFKILAYSSNF
jgi:hypothetical protein